MSSPKHSPDRVGRPDRVGLTVPDLIDRVLTQLRNQFYCDLPSRAFKVDEQALIAAIGTYGWECDQRGWEFDTDFIYRDLCQILRSFKHSGSEIKWMPNYLQHSIRQHIREHAEELSAAAKSIRAVADKALGIAVRKSDLVGTLPRPGRSPQPDRLPRPGRSVEVLGALHQDINKLRRRANADRRAKTAEQKKQKDLL